MTTLTDLDRDDEYLATVDTSADDELRERMQTVLEHRGWDITVRAARRGEVSDAVFVRKASGDWQVLGHSVPVPEELTRDMSDAWEAACKGPDAVARLTGRDLH